jgi:hypothetical protein
LYICIYVYMLPFMPHVSKTSDTTTIHHLALQALNRNRKTH